MSRHVLLSDEFNCRLTEITHLKRDVVVVTGVNLRRRDVNGYSQAAPATATFDKPSEIAWKCNALQCLRQNKTLRLQHKSFLFQVLP